jgi:hypothetical protein
MKAEFNDVVFIDGALLAGELDDCFKGRSTNPLFEALTRYKDMLQVTQRLVARAPDVENHRLFVTPMTWALYQAFLTLYARSALLFASSFKEKKLNDWREDEIISQNLCAVLPSSIVEAEKLRPHGGLSRLVHALDNKFLREVDSKNTSDSLGA